MSAQLGKNGVFKMDNGAGTLTTLSGSGSGLQSFSYTLSNAVREIPGQNNAVQRQSLAMRDLKIDLVIDVKSETIAVFSNSAGNVRTIELGPGGSTSGMEKIGGEMLVEEVSISGEYNAALQYNVSLVLSSALSVGTY